MTYAISKNHDIHSVVHSKYNDHPTSLKLAGSNDVNPVTNTVIAAPCIMPATQLIND